MARLARQPRFLTDLTVTHLDRQWYRLDDPLQYRSRVLMDVVTVPEGFVTDFASVPRFPVVYWFAGSRADEPAVVHDYLYRYTSMLDSFENPRYRADRTFLEAMNVKNYSRFTRLPMYWGVRGFGRLSYDIHGETLDPR